MVTDEKLLLGRLLGEVFSLRKAQGLPVRESEATVYGLLKGFESAIKEILPEEIVTIEQEEAVGDILDPIFLDPTKLAAFKGYYDIEHDFQTAGIDRMTAVKCFRKFRLEGRFTSVIDKIEAGRTGGSPVECLNLTVRPEDL